VRPTSAPDLAAQFERQRYAVWRSLLAPDEVNRLYSYALLRVRSGTMSLTDAQVPQTPSAGGDFIMDGVLADLAPRVEQATGLELFPTYSYFRVYKRGDVLARHTDRPACEISLSVSLGLVADRAWPLSIEGPFGAADVALNPGDALLYRGIECPHGRDAFDGESAAQLFLHYVDRHGPHAAWKFDKRGALTAFPVQR
jgi:hypothetical protein